MKIIILFSLFLNMEVGFLNSVNNPTQDNVKKYCYRTSAGKFEIALFEGEERRATYKLYNMYGDLQKTMQGTWVIRDEGVYGPAYMLTLNWTGLNVNMPALKFVCQYDGNGRLQGLIDGQNRSWSSCN